MDLMTSLKESNSLSFPPTWLQARGKALRHVGRYEKAEATPDYGISFSSWSHAALESFVEFPIDDSKDKPHPMAFADANWRPQDASIPSDSNARSIDLGETRSVCGHLVFLSNGPLI
jgi:hypothetical protein